MKVYIQEIESGRYFKNPFVWVEDKSEAYNFMTSLEAFDFCLQMNDEHGARILLSFDDPQHEICLFSFESQKSAPQPVMQSQVPVPHLEHESEMIRID